MILQTSKSTSKVVWLSIYLHSSLSWEGNMCNTNNDMHSGDFQWRLQFDQIKQINRLKQQKQSIISSSSQVFQVVD